MGFTDMAYTPSDGLKNKTSFVTTPVSEDAARKQIQDMFDQVTTYVNDTLLSELEDDTSGSSGGEKIGTAAILGLSTTTVAGQLAELKTIADTAAAANLTAGSISNSNMFGSGVVPLTAMAADSVDSDQYVDGSIDHAHLATDCVDGTNIADDSIDSEHYVDLSIDTAHLSNLSVTEGKLAADAVTGTKIKDGSVTTSKLGTVSTLTLATGDTIKYDDANGQIQFKVAGCSTVYLCPVIYGTGATPPAGTYPKGTIYVQYSV